MKDEKKHNFFNVEHNFAFIRFSMVASDSNSKWLEGEGGRGGEGLAEGIGAAEGESGGKQHGVAVEALGHAVGAFAGQRSE